MLVISNFKIKILTTGTEDYDGRSTLYDYFVHQFALQSGNIVTINLNQINNYFTKTITKQILLPLPSCVLLLLRCRRRLFAAQSSYMIAN